MFAAYITNYSCGPDSILVPLFREIMNSKPSLTLELDQHTADAGVNTRIDAFLDVIKNFRKNNHDADSSTKGIFKPSKIVTEGRQSFFIDSEGRKYDLKHPDVQVVVPCIGDMAAALFAASLRSLGYNAIAMPEMDHEVVETGLKYTSGKECLPLILLAGTLMNYVIKNGHEGKNLHFSILAEQVPAALLNTLFSLPILLRTKRLQM
jgi:predicted nucleotide-binding protein (sugar kinase/HSP70/actin superfamily)